MEGVGSPAFFCQLCRAKLNLTGLLDDKAQLGPPYGNRIDESFIVLDDKRQGATRQRARSLDPASLSPWRR